MSYDHWLFPAPWCDDPRALEAALETDLPATPTAAALAAELNAAAAASDERLFTVSPLEASGDLLVVPSPFGSVQEVRDVLIPLAFAAGYAVHDPQLAVDLDPRTATPGELTTDEQGSFPVITPALIDHLVANMTIDDFVIVATDDQVYMQSACREFDAYQLEYRDGSADRHFGTEVATADEVAAAMRGWLAGDDSSYRDLDWEQVTF
ncbi:hypothetical protein G7070_09335 [Propioniciclava coleopterorum]|uniref:Uncharacterized protein n=1 Tax=Propioniciclava coleopterorum TaxID=2714937 RepID=A0A6G7Y6I9_9ACTN|nr:hypothetical protein [Propioniciclava coleopterorum]QIK72432.1 hypothetical protein G7070_09335 [Propioniciclava coleopterorum]